MPAHMSHTVVFEGISHKRLASFLAQVSLASKGLHQKPDAGMHLGRRWQLTAALVKGNAAIKSSKQVQHASSPCLWSIHGVFLVWFSNFGKEAGLSGEALCDS